MKQVIISKKLISETLSHLQAAGEERSEGVVLWLAEQNGESAKVVEVFRPEQQSTWGNFRIPRDSMASLMQYLRTTRRFIPAQVHSHPNEAFHSPIDDEWAIVRHKGALSLLLPYFAMQTTVDSFLIDTAVFKLSGTNTWEQVIGHQIIEHYQIIDE